MDKYQKYKKNHPTWNKVADWTFFGLMCIMVIGVIGWIFELHDFGRLFWAALVLAIFHLILFWSAVEENNKHSNKTKG